MSVRKIRPWSADLAVSEPLARSVIEAQFPDLAPVRIEPLGVGWDNTALLVNDVYVFRFPRRQIAVDCLEAETRVLPAIAPRLPLPVPVPTLVGQPDDRFPWPFAGYRMIEGRTACVCGLDDGQRVRAAEPIARFLAALHAVGAEEATGLGAGPDTLGRLDFAKRVPQARQYLDRIVEQGLFGDVDPLAAVIDETARGEKGVGEKGVGSLFAPAGKAMRPGNWQKDSRPLFPAASTSRTKTLVHGDLYARHLLVDAEGRPSGVIDWGDVHVGDPAIDLAIAHSFFPPDAHDAFRRAYGRVDDETWRLARFRAVHHTAIIVVYGHDVGDRDLFREGLTSLRYLASQ